MYPRIICQFIVIEFENGAVLWFTGSDAAWRYEGGFLG